MLTFIQYTVFVSICNALGSFNYLKTEAVSFEAASLILHSKNQSKVFQKPAGGQDIDPAEKQPL